MGWTQAPARVPGSLHDQDEHAWLHQQAELLLAGRVGEIDGATLAKFLIDMAKRDERELRSRLIVLIQHMLKVSETAKQFAREHQPGKLSGSWADTIDREQDEIEQLLKSASLARLATDLVAEAWPVAVRRAARETGLPESTFPQENPWTVEQALGYQPPQPAPHPAGPVRRRTPRAR